MAHKKTLPSLLNVMALLVLFSTLIIHYQITVAQENPSEPPPAETPEATLLPSPTEAPTETPTPPPAPPGDSAAITVAMSAVPSSGAAPLTVTFSDASSPGLTDWAWDFGDGGSATGPGPHSHTYANPGTYTASLTASGSGGSGTASQQIVVFPPVTPVEARFSAQQTGETTVCFTQSSTGPVTASAWDFGDGAISPETDPCHSYASVGQYTVTLTVTAEGGATSSAAQRISLLPPSQPPVAAFSMSRSTATISQTVRFADQSLGLIQSWAWDFGDGTTSSERQPAKQYSANGTYTITLTVTGPGGSDQETAAITIAPETVLTCSFSAPSSVFAGETVTLRNTSRVSPGSFSGFTWYVDGQPAATTTDLTTSFSAEGTASVRLVGLTEDGRACESQRSLSVLPADSVIANFSGIRSVIVGEDLCLRDQSRGAITAWFWDFDDDSLSTEVNPCHAFNRAGRYDIRLTVSGASGASDSRSRAVTVYDPPTLTASASPLSGVAPLAVNFSAEGTNLTSYQWSFPDGSRAFSAAAQFVFDQPGDYTVSVTGSGPVGSLTASLRIGVRAPGDLRAAFGASAWNGIAPLEICFSDRSAGDAITAWNWNFGDGATSADPNPCHTFTRAGEYPVSLTVANGDGLSASASSTVRIYSPASGSASFRVVSVSDLTVCFASSLQDGLALTRWEFGDGSTSTESAPCHPYPAPGVYAVTLIVTDLSGVERALRSSVSVSQGSAAPVEAAAPSPNSEVYDPALSKIGFLPAGSIGLPGEALHWVTTVTNVSGAAESNLVIVDQVRPELRIDAVLVANGSSYSVNGQRVEVTIPSLLPGQSQDFTIVTTVLTSPLNGILDNTVTDNLGGSATATVSVPAGGIVANAAPPLPNGPIPLVNGVPELVDFAGRPFCFTPNFTNAGTREGYGPYITLVRDPNLALNSISYLGINLMASPYLVASGLLPAADPIEGRAIPGLAGQAWMTVRLPIGSLETISPPIPIDICMQSLPLAALGVPMPISIYPGYEFGDTPTGANGPISNLNDQGPMDNTGSFTPILVTFAKSNTLPESEVPPSCYPAPPVGAVGQPGPACAAPPGVQWPYEYVLSIELAAGQTLTANTFTDTLDPAFEFYPYTFPVTALADAVVIGGTCTPSGASATFNGSPITALPALQPPGGGTLAISFGSIANPSVVSTCTLTMRYRGFINDILSESAAPEAYGAVNNASFTYSHVSGPQPVLTATNTVDVRNLQIQKGASPGSVTPDTVVNYTLSFQLSEYIGIQTLSVTDIIPDGIDYNVGSAVVNVPGLGSAAINGANESISYGVDTGTLVFNVTGALPGPYPSAGTITITYTGTVRQTYRAGGTLTGYVSANDTLPNTATASFTTTAGQSFTDNTGASVRVIPNSLTKNLVSAPVDATTGFVPGEPVTFRLVLRIPSGDTRNLVIEDNFPLPVFIVQDADFGIEASSFTLPDPTGRSAPFDVSNTNGYCASYPNVSFPFYTRPCGLRFIYDAVGTNGTNVPAGTGVTVTRVGNTVRLNFNAPVETSDTSERRIVVELTAGIIDRPFNDGLFLANRSLARYTNTAGVAVTLNADDYVDVAAPDIQICKGITATTNAASLPVAGTPCGIPGAPNNDLSDVDASDVLTYQITARNIGGARAYGVQISDNATTVPELTGCALVSVADGTGVPLAFSGTFPNLTLTNPLPGAGSGSVADAQATAVVTYTCTVASNLAPASAPILNRASVVFSTFSDTLPGGVHLSPATTPFAPRSDVAQFTPRLPDLIKTRVPATATIGELITYTLRLDVPGGTMNNVAIVDTLDAGLAFVDCTSAIATAPTLTSSLGAINAANFCNDGTGANNPVVSGGGGVVTWNLGNLTSTGTSASDINSIVITYTAVVLNQAANVRGQLRNNSAVLGWDNPAGGRLTDSAAAPDTRIIEPALEVDKTAAPSTNVDANDLVTFTLIVRHAPGSDATAYDIQLTDVIPAGLTYVAGSLSNTGGVAPATLTESSGTITATYASLTTAQTSTLQYQARLAANVQPGQVITNTAQVVWTSVSGTPAFTAYNPLGVERTGNASDPGLAANTYLDTDPASVTVANPSSAKTITATSVAQTGNGSDADPDLTIGESVTYQITVTFREGLTRAAVIRDNLPTGTAVLGLVSSRIVSLGANLSFSSATPAVGQAGTATDTNADAVLDRVEWALSDVTNTADNLSSAADTIVVEVIARVLDVAANSGLAPTQDLNVTNTAQIRYTDFGGTTRAQNGTATVDLVEPRLTIAKTVLPTSADAGDTVTYTVVVANTGTGPAFNVVITDPLTATAPLVAGTVTTSAGTIVTGNTLGDTSIRVDVSPLAAGGSVTITYQAVILPSAFPGQQIINTAAQTFNSMPDNSGRPGSGSDPATVTVLTPGLTKTITATSESYTFPGATNQYMAAPDLTIGEVVTYQMPITVPEGTSSTLRLVDTLPSVGAGDPGTLTYISSRVVSIGGSIGGSALAVGAPGSIAGQTITFDFTAAGSITNTPDGIANANDIIVVEVVARAENLAANAAGDLLTNRAALTYDGGSTVNATAAVDVVEPQLDVQKTAAPTTNLNAGDVVTFSIVVNHTIASTADAFDLRIVDVIPAGLTYVAGSLTNAAGIAATLDATAAPTLTLTWDTLALGQTSTITYQARIDNAITHNLTLTNTANLGYSSLDDGTPTSNDPTERTYTDSDPASVTTNLTPLSFAKNVVATSEAYTTSAQFGAALPDLTIGETVTYELRARLQEGVIPVTLTDTLPAGLVFLSTQLAPTNGANVSLSGAFPAPTVVGQVMTLNLGNVVNTADNLTNANDDLVIWIIARAADLPVNVGTTGADLINTATLNWGGGTLTDTEAVEIVEPQLDVQKTAAPFANLNAGDVVTFSIVVNHTAASTADAFDLRIVDVIPAGLTYVAGSLTNAAGIAATLDATATPTLTLTWDTLALGQTSTVTYQARIDNAITHNLTLTNTANLGYSSLDDGTPTTNDPTERTYTDSDPASVTTNLTPLSFAKNVVATSEAYTTSAQFGAALPDLTIGETVTYELRARLQEGITPVTLTDTLPAGLVFLSVQLAPTNGANVSLSGAFPAPTVVGQVMTLNLGNVVNAADNVVNAADDLVIWIIARAADLPVNVGTTGADLINTATLNWGGGTLTDTEAVEIVEPQLDIQKSVSPTTNLNAGALLTYTLVLTHTAASTADAQDIRIQDAIPAGITFGAVNAAASTCDDRAGWSLDSSGLPASVVFRFDDLPLGITCTLTYTATVANSVTHGQVLTNVASLGYSSLDDGTPDTNDPNERAYTDSDDATVTINLAPISFVKNVVATSEAYTTSAQFDAALPDLTIGETVTYELRARLQEGTTPVTLTDTLPDGIVFISAQISPFNGLNISLTGPFPTPVLVGQVMTLNFGNVVNAADNLTNLEDDLVIWVWARAADLPVNVGTTGADLINTAVLDWGGGTLTDTEAVEIVEPQLDITLTAAPSANLDAGDIVTYTVTVTHLGTSTADALDVAIANLIPADMTYLGNLAAVTGPLPAVSGTNPNIRFFWDTIPLGSTYTFTFQAVLDNSVSPAQTLTDTATLTWNTLDDDNDPNERNYTDSAQVSVTTRLPALDKTIVATSLTETGTAQHVAGDTDLNIGETVTYQIVITMPEGDAPLILTDNLPDVMTVVSATVVRLGANITTTGLGLGGSAVLSNSNYPADGLADRAVFNFGLVTNTADNVANAADELVVEVVARLDENALNVDADRLTNAAALDYGSGSLSDSITVDVTEPRLDIQKSALVVTGRPGDIIDYTITVGHLPASTGPAYDLVITDPLLPNLTLIPGTVTTTRGTVVTGNAAGDTQLRVVVPLLNLGETVTVTYQGRISANITPPVSFVNTAALAYDSAAGVGGRPLSGSDTHTIRVNDDIYRYAKTVAATSVTQTGSAAYTAAPDATIGETVTFQIEAYLPEGVTTRFIITDNLPDGLIVVSNRVLAIGSNLTVGSLAVGAAGTASNSNYPADGLDDRVVFDFGSVTNLIDGLDDIRDIIRVEVVARVYDDRAGLNVDGRTATNHALIDYGPNRREATAPVDIVEPRLTLSKTFIPRVEGRGHELLMTLELVNTGGSTAYSVGLDDPLNIGLCLNRVTVDTSAALGSTVTDASTLGCGGRVNLGIDQLAPGGRIRVTTELQIDPALSLIPQSIPNTAEVVYQSMPPSHPDAALGRRYRASAGDTLRVDQPTLTLTKVAEPARVRAGGLLTYTLTVTNTGDPAIDAYEVLVTDTLPDALSLISARPAQGSCAVSGQTLTCALGTLLRGTSTTIVIETRVATTAAPNSRIINRALVRSLEGSQAEAEATVVILPDDTCEAGCPDVQLYHSDRTGNWDIFRLGAAILPGTPDANPNLTQNPAADVEPSQSPDGRWMAFASNRDGNWEIYVAPIDGRPEQAVRVTYNTVASDTDPAWGPTDHLVYESSRDGNWELYLFNLRTGQETRLTDNPADDLNAFWSPDGSRVLFQSDRSGRWQIYELNLVSGALRPLSDGRADEVDAAYSNSGTRIVFRAITPAGSVILTMNADGSGRQTISAPTAHAANAVWSPDDRLIAYQSDLDGDLDIYVYEPATGTTRQLTDNAIADYAPTWRCGTERVLFTSEITGSPEVFEADARSLDAPAIDVLAEAAQLTNHPGQDIYPLGAPGEENASLEGRLPADPAAEIGHTAILRPDWTLTPPDLSIIEPAPWQPITTCLPLAGEPPAYRLDRFPAR